MHLFLYILYIFLILSYFFKIFILLFYLEVFTFPKLKYSAPFHWISTPSGVLFFRNTQKEINLLAVMEWTHFQKEQESQDDELKLSIISTVFISLYIKLMFKLFTFF